MQLAKLYILDKKLGNYDYLSLKYIISFIFWLEKTISLTIK